MTAYDLVVSAENDPYLEWQAMLFHHSCVRRVGRAPIVVVHGEGPLRAGYRLIEETGGRIQRAPSFRRVGEHDYPPRNAAGTLACVDTAAARVVLCDPDMIFLRGFDAAHPEPDEIGVERSTYLRVNVRNRAHLELACTEAGVRLETLEQDPIDAGVPIVVPAELRERLARDWLHCIDLVLGLPLPETLGWLTSMWALVLAVRRLGLRTVTSEQVVANERGAPPPRADPSEGPALLHYCYGDDAFEKRDFFGDAERCERVWQLEPLGGAGLAERLRDEVAAAHAFYGLRASARSA